jgi:hypothetical protein
MPINPEKAARGRSLSLIFKDVFEATAIKGRIRLAIRKRENARLMGPISLTDTLIERKVRPHITATRMPKRGTRGLVRRIGLLYPWRRIFVYTEGHGRY